ncbi:hypothetical protein SteCoe_3414 [Stentor coeruleus]|uniref:Uncharacterized protein n=1 Tax=Stentor coeruleus TaxID=5963 RepID=A0A1R2CX39_9CILI|nr:hypothetical protein SteCoe_3414 [Stentor coeruleus]
MIIQFPWTERWLNGAEYEHMIKFYNEYMSELCLQIYFEHPSLIYTSPSHGLIYYLKSQSLRDLGFPRIKGLKKPFKWKKMNFITNLPKQKPRVTYLVATGKLSQLCYRMHIVYYKEQYPILCHMLRIQNHFKIGVGIPSRQHFKENFKGYSEERNEKFCEDNKSVVIELDEDVAMHPLKKDALMYMVCRFRGSLEELGDNVTNKCKY